MITTQSDIAQGPSRIAAPPDPIWRSNARLLEALSAKALGCPPHLMPSLEQHPGEIARDHRQILEVRSLSLRPVVTTWQMHDHIGKIGNTLNDWMTSHEPAACAFRRYAFCSKQIWQSMKNKGHAVAYESLDYILGGLLRPGNHLIEAAAMPLQRPSADRHFTTFADMLAYCQLTKGSNNIKDYKHLPIEYQSLPEIVRGEGIFAVSRRADMLFPKDFLRNLVFNQAIKIAGPLPILTKIVMKPEEYAYLWSKLAMEQLGFRPTGKYLIEDVVLPVVAGVREHEEAIKLYSEWFIYEPQVTTPRQHRHSSRMLDQRRWVNERIQAGSHFPSSGAPLVFCSKNRGDNEALLFAEQQRNNAVLALEFNPSISHPYRENLAFGVASPKGTDLPPASVSGFFNLNIQPEVAEKGPHTDASENIQAFLLAQLTALEIGGRHISREMPRAEWPERVVLRIPYPDKTAAAKIQSTMDFFLTFVRANRLAVERLPERPPDFEQWRLSGVDAQRFIYLNLWRQDGAVVDAELTRPPAFFSFPEFVELGRSHLGCRVVSASEVYTPWVMDRLVQLGVSAQNDAGEELPLPGNQMEMILEKVASTEGVAVEEIDSRPIDAPRFLRSRFFKRDSDNAIREFISRSGNRVFCPLLVSELNGRLIVWGKQDYPRGIPNAMLTKTLADGTPRDFLPLNSISSGYVIESLAAAQLPGESAYETVRRCLIEQAHLPEDEIPSGEQLAILPKYQVLPSASTVDERRVEFTLQVSPAAQIRAVESGYSGLSTSGIVRPFDLLDLIGTHSGGPSASMQMANMAYRELLIRDIPLPPWNGVPIRLTDQCDPGIKVTPAAEAFGEGNWTGPKWEELTTPPPKDRRFFEIRSGRFAERRGDGTLIHNRNGELFAVDLEYAVTAAHLRLSCNTMPLQGVLKVSGRILFAYERRDDLPLVEELLNQNTLTCCHAFRIPCDLKRYTRTGAEAWAVRRFEEESSARVLRLIRLSDNLLVSAGLLPERSSPNLVELLAESCRKNPNLVFCDALDVLQHHDKVACAHTLTTLFLGTHALSLRSESSIAVTGR